MTDDGQHLLKPQRVSLPQQALRYLRSLIGAGVYQPGDQLPSQTELAAQPGISRPTLREALLGLEQEGGDPLFRPWILSLSCHPSLTGCVPS